jgi:hypothetical protein
MGEVEKDERTYFNISPILFLLIFKLFCQFHNLQFLASVPLLHLSLFWEHKGERGKGVG